MHGRLVVLLVPDSALMLRLDQDMNSLRAAFAALGKGDQIDHFRRENAKIITSAYPLTLDIASVFGHFSVDLTAVSKTPGFSAIPLSADIPTSSFLPNSPFSQSTLAILPVSHYNSIKTAMGGHQILTWTSNKVNIDLNKLVKREIAGKYVGDDYAARLLVDILPGINEIFRGKRGNLEDFDGFRRIIGTEMGNLKTDLPDLSRISVDFDEKTEISAELTTKMQENREKMRQILDFWGGK